MPANALCCCCSDFYWLCPKLWIPCSRENRRVYKLEMKMNEPAKAGSLLISLLQLKEASCVKVKIASMV